MHVQEIVCVYHDGDQSYATGMFCDDSPVSGCSYVPQQICNACSADCLQCAGVCNDLGAFID